MKRPQPGTGDLPTRRDLTAASKRALDDDDNDENEEEEEEAAASSGKAASRGPAPSKADTILAGPAAGGIRKKHRFRPGTVALREIRKYQNSTERLIPRAPFVRLVREIAQEHGAELRWRASALGTLHEAIEMLVVDSLSDAQDICLRRKASNTDNEDLRLAMWLKYKMDAYRPKDYVGLPKRGMSQIVARSIAADDDDGAAAAE